MCREKHKASEVLGAPLEVGLRLEGEQGFVPHGEGAVRGFFVEKVHDWS